MSNRRQGGKGRAPRPSPAPASGSPPAPDRGRPAGSGRSGGRVPPTVVATGVVLILGLLGWWAGVLTGLWGQTPGRAPNGAAPTTRQRPAERIEATGRLLIPLEAGLALVTLPDRAVTPIIPAGATSTLTSATWSPDGSTAAYALYHIRSGDSAASSEIYLTDLGGQTRPLVERDRPGTTVEAPAWAPDGQSIYFSYSGLEGQRLVQRVERVNLASRARTVVGEGAFPAVSPTGEQVALVRGERTGDALLLIRPDGQAIRELIPAGRFSLLGAARFTPDGRTLAIPASGGAQADAPTPTRPFGLLAPNVAFAHGEPWDVFLIDVEGGEPRRLTQLIEDEISVAWSPDGSRLAVYGVRGLHLVDRQGGTTFAMDRGGYGGIDWAP